MAISVGVDAGVETLKTVVLNGGQILYCSTVALGAESVAAVSGRQLDEAEKKTGLSLRGLESIGVTGVYADDLPFARKKYPEIICAAIGINRLCSQVHTVLDAGAGHFTGLKCSQGKVLRIAKSDKCAAGVGFSLRIAAGILEMQVQDMSDAASRSQEEVVITSTCSVFAESEIISLVHAKKRPEDIVKGVFRGLSSRLYSLLLAVGIDDDVAMIGGVANCRGIVDIVESVSGHKLFVPPDPSIMDALGAALAVSDGGERP